MELKLLNSEDKKDKEEVKTNHVKDGIHAGWYLAGLILVMILLFFKINKFYDVELKDTKLQRHKSLRLK